MSSPPSGASGITDTELGMVRRYGTVLELWPADAVEKLSVGRSGSLVVRLTLAGQRLVLKITTDPARVERAASEVQMIADAPAEILAVMPRYVGGCIERDAVCLVTQEYQPLPRPGDIVAPDWVALATALGSLHAAPVPRWPALETSRPPTVGAVADAEEFWAQIGHADDAKRAAKLIHDSVSQSGVALFATVLEHGDCHTENIVRDENNVFRWIDWQEAHLGSGFGDLVFLCQRAEFTGADPPRRAMTAAYAAARNVPPGQEMDREINLAELRLLFLSWPPFLAYGSPQNQERMTARLARLIDALT